MMKKEQKGEMQMRRVRNLFRTMGEYENFEERGSEGEQMEQANQKNRKKSNKNIKQENNIL